MLTREQIAELIRQPEGPLLERKTDGVKPQEIRQTVGAFANTVSEPDEAVLFIGVRDDGRIEGCKDVDRVQKTVREVCDSQCYPAIKYRVVILTEHNNVVAVIVPPSTNRPHFTGVAYVRRGSESVAAPAEVFDELVHSRISKVARLLAFKKQHTIFRVIGLGHKLGETRRLDDVNYREVMQQCKVAECDPHYVRFQRIDGDGRRFSEPLDNISITYNEEKWCPEIIVKGH
jgi:hypothetical protein